MQFITSRISRAYVIWTVITTVAVEAILAGLFLVPGVTFDHKVGVSLFATVPAFVITIIQLIRTQQIQRAGFIKDFLTEFHRDNDLHTGHYDLVYRFRNEIYDQVKVAADAYLKSNPKPGPLDKPIFDCFKHLQVSDMPGTRFFYPLFFQFSPEEKKLDGLLDYFNSVGLYLYEGLVRMEDIVTLLGDYLAVLADRKVIAEYMELCNNPSEWKYDDSVGASKPYQHLRFLLESYEEYNLQEYQRRKIEELEDAINKKRQQVAARKKRQ